MKDIAKSQKDSTQEASTSKVNIHIDFDETLAHSMYCRDSEDAQNLKDLYHFFPSVTLNLGDGEQYISFLRSFSRDLIEFCRNLVGFENVYICSVGARDYVTTANLKFGLGFPENQINAREDMVNKKFAGDGINILIDNYHHNYHWGNKVPFLGLDDPDLLIKVDHFYADIEDIDEKDHFTEIKTRIQSVYETITSN
jgi:hypothetical protein